MVIFSFDNSFYKFSRVSKVVVGIQNYNMIKKNLLGSCYIATYLNQIIINTPRTIFEFVPMALVLIKPEREESLPFGD